MLIRPIQKSKIESVDFDNLSFGTIFSDHMFICDYADGAWGEPEIIPYAPIQLDPSASALHYGQAIFEGPAIINFLLETHDTNLIAPIGNPDRAVCFQWLSFLSTALLNANNRFFFSERYGSTEIVIKEKAVSDRKDCYDILEKHVDAFLSGKTCGIADFYFYVLMNWDENKADELAKRPNLEKIFNQVNQKTSVQKVLKSQTS